MWSSWTWLLTMFVVVVVATNDVFPPPPDPAETDSTITQQHRDSSDHHTVHNLVLNPEQHSLCELKHIRQIVTHAHCTSKEMENYVCVGTCFSYTVPQTEPETPGDEQLDYCDSCQASESHWTTIQLDCEEYGNAYQVTKNIQMITNCSCSPCHPTRSQPTIDNNEVTYAPNDHHHVNELIFKMLPDGHKFKEGLQTVQRPDTNRELQYTEMSIDNLKKRLYNDPHPEQLLRGKVIYKHSASFTDNDQ
ncbi:neuroblastoma suppressor of tumorigenicity 1-like [Homarus americanus]|uniref:Neuroblastoma suppressor of tumorigenicity 1-like n=1 Tax=Homarus americanus TaxID=6706 RepID=A0A8J5TCU7_HOMAM|nr:neuroblastoma suppressor of tumorigenicity 1-like [Homarus americanus]KAG7171992.1 Neuroblastoma suppressor of tumorigenicity 1-like [Homarus americanus]